MTRSPSNRRLSPAGLAALALVALAMGATALVVRSPLFHLRRVRVEGNVRLSADDVSRLAGVQPSSNLLLLSLGAIERSVGASPWVANAEARRDLPATLVISVTERRPVGWVADPEGGAVVAADGTVLRRRRSAGSLVSLGEIDSPLRPGDRVSEIGPRLDVLVSLPRTLQRQLSHVHARGDELVLRLKSGGRIIYGGPLDLNAKRAALESVLSWAGERGLGVHYIDVRAPKTPALLPVP